MISIRLVQVISAPVSICAQTVVDILVVYIFGGGGMSSRGFCEESIAMVFILKFDEGL